MNVFVRRVECSRMFCLIAGYLLSVLFLNPIETINARENFTEFPETSYSDVQIYASRRMNFFFRLLYKRLLLILYYMALC